MKKTLKAVISAIIVLTLVLSTVPFAFAEDVTAKLYNVYGDSMLFKQNDEAVISGTGTGGARITCALTDADGKVIRKATGYVNRSGEFKVSFTAPEGGYETYTITMYVNDVPFRVLKDVVFGELWLSSGQSNMQYDLAQCSNYEQNKTGSKWTRFLYINALATYQGKSDVFPLEAQKDIDDGNCAWIKGSSTAVSRISAVTFFFAQKLQKELDMPVGVLAPNLGGSTLDSWLSRETVENDPYFKDVLVRNGLYVSEKDWADAEINYYSTVTTNYNLKTYALRNFKIAGMIWYQGESEVMYGTQYGEYLRGLELLQQSYGELFGFEGEMPFILTQLVPYAYRSQNFAIHNFEFSVFQQKSHDSRAMITVNDIDMGYNDVMGAIHPETKQPVGERMACCAEGLVYGMRDCCTAANIDSYRIDGSDVYVDFRDVGDGLKADGRIYGFALCEEGGIYVQADAQIVDENTVRVYSAEVEKPVAVTYSMAENNGRSNLYSTEDGQLIMPAACFTTDIENDVLYWEDPAWTDCDTDRAWLLESNDFCGFYNPWTADRADIEITADSAYKGAGGLSVKTDSNIKKNFSVSPRFGYKEKLEKETFDLGMFDWSNYSKITVMVRNNGKDDITLKSMKIYVNSASWYAPDVNGCGEAKTVIPADGEWHKLTFDLDRLYFFGNECGCAYSRAKLGKIEKVNLCFNGKAADLSIDEFRFTADPTDGSGAQFDTTVKQADNPFEFISALFVVTIGAIIRLFK